MANKIRLGIVGGGGDSLIGVLHRIAANMFDRYELIGGVFNPDFEANLKFATSLGLSPERVYKDLDTMIEEESRVPVDQRMEAVSVLTPNFLHYPMAKKLLENGFHVICEKPLTTSYEEALSLKNTLELSQREFAVTYTYSGYPMVRQMKRMIEEGIIGRLQKVDAQYYQGWINPIIHDKEQRASTWRLQPEKSGISCCIGDIGIHAFHMIEYAGGIKINEVLADLNTVYDDNPLDVDGTVLVRADEGIKGVIRASQIATAEENSFVVKFYGEKGALKWEQENPNYLTFLEEGKPIQILKPGNTYNSSLSLDGTKLPPGHPEGIFDAMGNIYTGMARAIRKQVPESGEYPLLDEGKRGMLFIEQVVASHQEGNVWKSLDD